MLFSNLTIRILEVSIPDERWAMPTIPETNSPKMHQTVDDWKKKSPFRACHLFKCKLVSFREGIQYTFFSKGNVVIKYLIRGGVWFPNI